jgi:WD40 repeat protein
LNDLLISSDISGSIMRNVFLFILILIILVSCTAKDGSEVQIPTLTSPQSADLNPTQETSTGGGYSLDVSKLEVISSENAARLEELEIFAGHSDVVTWVTFSLDGSKLASSGFDRLVRLWELTYGIEYASLRHGYQAFGTDFSPDGIHLASAGTDKVVRIWNVETAEQIMALEGHAFGVINVAYSPDGKLLSSASRDGSIFIWDPDNGQVLRTIKAHYGDVYGLAYHPDGSMLASSGSDDSVWIWDPNTGEELQLFTDHQDDVFDVNFSQDGTMMVTCGGGLSERDNSVRVWDTSSWSVITHIADREAAVVGCDFSVDARLLITRENNGAISFWDLQSLEIIKTLDFPGFWFTYAFDFDSEGRLMAIADANGAVHLYGVPE